MLRLKTHNSAWFVGVAIGLALVLGNRVCRAQTPTIPVSPGVLENLPTALRQNATLQTDFTALFEAYGNALRGVECNDQNQVYLIMRDGQRLIYDDGRAKNCEEKLKNPDLEDMLSQIYPPGRAESEVPLDFDPGRIRVEAFFDGVYGATVKQVKDNLVAVKFAGATVPFNSHNGAAAALAKVGERLTQVNAEVPGMKAYVVPLGGTHNRRPIAGTNRLSAHSWGIAIDLNPTKSKYWRWGKSLGVQELLKMRAGFPWPIIAAFEEHGFIWGGKWFHYDTMHFEYRPELLAKARLVALNHEDVRPHSE